MDLRSEATLKGRAVVFLKGMAMGIADSVPGVSGGTVAVMAGIYEELIHSLKNLNPVMLWSYRTLGLKGFWHSINGSFLLALLLGIFSSLYLSASTVLFLLEHHYPAVMAFFCGLVLASTWFLRRQVSQWNRALMGFLVLGAGVTLLLSLSNPLSGSSAYLYIFCCGLIAICAMILPGISGAFILILLGVYDQVLNALRVLDLGIMVVFAAGCGIGLLSFSHVLSWTFFYYRQQTYAFLIGMLIASVLVLWPWKYVAEETGHGSRFLGPAEFETLTGTAANLPLVIFLLLLGFALVTVFERITRKRI
jgi:putative membrane protein